MGKSLALLIGIDDYKFEPLTSCVNDAVAMREALVQRKIVREDQCTLMTSPQRTDSILPTRDAILDALQPVFEAKPPFDRLFVFFAGHGLAVRLGRGGDELHTALVTAGAPALKNAGRYMIDVDELLSRFARRGAAEQLWIFDCCRNQPKDLVPTVPEVDWDQPAALGATTMVRSAIYAVPPLGKARAVAGEHGVLTGHLLDALHTRGDAQWGAASEYSEDAGTWRVTDKTLYEYARRRVELAVEEKTPAERQYLVPRAWDGEGTRTPIVLFDLDPLPPRPLVVTVDPREAGDSVRARLTQNARPITAWPPTAFGVPVEHPPGRYRLVASLAPEQREWTEARVDPLVDLRRSGEVCIRVTGGPARLAAERSASTPLKIVNAAFARSASLRPAIITVRASDPGATVRVSHMDASGAEHTGAVNAPIAVSPGLCRVEVLIGDDVLAALEDDFTSESRYDIELGAQITPALADLWPAARTVTTVAMPSESIGPMQGAILPTLLPMLALKPFDTVGHLLRQLTHSLAIARLRGPISDAPASIALAIDGDWPTGAPRSDRARCTAAGVNLPLVWASKRVAIYAQQQPRARDGLRVEVPGWGVLELPAPRVPPYVTVAGLVLRPDGTFDTSIGLCPRAIDPAVLGKMSRARAVASRLYRASAELDDLNIAGADLYSWISSGSFGDPILGALAWFGRRRWQARHHVDTAELTSKQRIVHDFLLRVAPSLSDTRVIQALSQAAPEAALDELLADPQLEQPIMADAIVALALRALATGDPRHWAVLRYQQLPRNAVCNVIMGD